MNQESWFRSQNSKLSQPLALSAQPSTSTQNSKLKTQNLKLISQAQPIANPICPAQLGRAINRISDRVGGARWGILVQTLGNRANRKTLFSRNPTTLLIPASNNKLLTTAAVLTKLGAEYRIRTSVYGEGTDPSLATLRIVGRGDPSLTTAQLTSLTQQLRQKGIQQVTQLIGDDTYFRGAASNPDWDREDTLTGYGAPVNSLMLNQNGIGLTLFPQRVGQPLRVQWNDPTDREQWRLNNRSVTVSASSGEYVDAYRDANQRMIWVEGQLRAGSDPEPVAVSVPNPGNYLVAKFRTALETARVTVASSTVVKSTPTPPGLVELGAIDSPPLSQLLVETNRESNNIYAEALLKTLGRIQTPTNLNATGSGIAAVQTVLSSLGVNSTLYTMVDGSGLADRNRASTEALVQTLQAMAESPNAQVYRDSLAIAGINGTLNKRFRGTPVQGNLLGKTGTISGVVSLSGYLTPPNYPPLALSILVNHSSGSAATIRSAVDEIVLLLARLRSC
ncbi:D-alanyl-D-alanine carboxypeptidase/D-alanyl-D-alanine-endopeptidase [Kovacikia minuta CCNUW1]|uniref:D-alanyl-D-alanine carboxypeptidase/D-alanyl-D-alanine endopeptidase n=1 Tax=Kovacikia minuta TaxID=2931930 RepID=UPI001CC9618E|nr:D-alanyl-D-alanine carboxypeptidase/D-alanyl-D-alanine-endopeptidase [Kovacikia minuta]UBF26506.1 D-alanyl-D-alanine carboxypeptidase/D-alanyl-D-alanine-endopeptidase [Kovacikia minuta CCNUW1]